MKEMPGITQETKKKASGGTTEVAVAMATACAAARCRCHSLTGLDFPAVPASGGDSRTSGRGWAGPGRRGGPVPFGDGPGFPGGPGLGGGFADFGRWMGGRRPRRGPRVRRGNVRAAAIALLTEEPMNGYQIIQEIGERSGGVWRPSPG